MSVTAFLATKACFGACIAIYNLIDGDAPDALQEFGVAGGSVFAHYWARRGQKISVDNMCKLLEQDLQTHLDAERVADAPAILEDLKNFGPQYIGSAKAVSVADLIEEAHGRPEALTTIILERARLALPEDRQTWVNWQSDFADENTRNMRPFQRFWMQAIDCSTNHTAKSKNFCLSWRPIRMRRSPRLPISKQICTNG